METLKEYNIKFTGLKEGKHEFDFLVTHEFFEYFDFLDFNDINVNLNVVLNKKATMLEFDFNFSGVVNLNCDLTNEAYDHSLITDYRLLVKFGDDYNDTIENVLIIPHGEFEVDVKQYVYETIVLALPQKRIHPGVEDGTLKSEMLNRLEALSIGGQDVEEEKKENIDPRWDKLKKLLTDK